MHVSLRPYAPKDKPVLTRIRRNTDTQHALMTYPESDVPISQVDEWIHRRQKDPTGKFLMIVNSDDQCLGFTQLTNIHTKGHYAWFGIAIDEAYQQHGVGRAALAALLSHIRENLTLKKILLEVLETNTNAVSLYTSTGFRAVGLLLEHYHGLSQPQNVLIMEMSLKN